MYIYVWAIVAYIVLIIVNILLFMGCRPKQIYGPSEEMNMFLAGFIPILQLVSSSEMIYKLVAYQVRKVKTRNRIILVYHTMVQTNFIRDITQYHINFPNRQFSVTIGTIFNNTRFGDLIDRMIIGSRKVVTKKKMTLIEMEFVSGSFYELFFYITENKGSFPQSLWAIANTLVKLF
jgi:hypothetical protein